jgi:hypothetical protein
MGAVCSFRTCFGTVKETDVDSVNIGSTLARTKSSSSPEETVHERVLRYILIGQKTTRCQQVSNLRDRLGSETDFDSVMITTWLD